MGDKESKVIGFIAQRKGSASLLCDGDSAVVAGSESKMRSYLATVAGGSPENYVLKKTRYGDILRCLELGAAYSFDEQSYDRFYPLAAQEGKKVVEFGKGTGDLPAKSGLHLLQVRWV